MSLDEYPFLFQFTCCFSMRDLDSIVQTKHVLVMTDLLFNTHLFVKGPVNKESFRVCYFFLYMMTNFRLTRATP